MNKSQRASETQSKKIQQSIANIRKEISPVPTVSSIGSNPRAKPLSKARWMRRSVRTLGQTTTNALDILFSDIGTAMGATSSETYSVKVLGLKVWNITGPATTSNTLRVELNPSAISAGFTSITGEDFGNGSQLAGLKINVPDVLAVANSTSGTTKVCTVTTPFGGTAVQTIVADFDIVYQM